MMTFFGDPAWWVSVVVVGVAINFFSAYAKGWIDSGLGVVSAKWRHSSSKRKQAQLKQIELLAGSEYARLKAAAEVTQSMVYAVSFKVFALIAIYFTTALRDFYPRWLLVTVGVMAISCMAMALGSMMSAWALRRKVEAADKMNDPE